MINLKQAWLSQLFISLIFTLLSCKTDLAIPKFRPLAGKECNTCLLSRITTSSPVLESITISYNKSRQPHKLYYEYEHQLTRMDSCIYDSQQKLDKIQRYIYPANKEAPIVLTVKQFGYDSKGRIISSTTLSADLKSTEGQDPTYLYDNKNYLLGSRINFQDLGEQRYEYIYNAKDNPKSENYHIKGSLTAVKESTYDTTSGILNHPLLKYMIDDVDFPIRSFYGRNNPLTGKTTFKGLSTGIEGNSEVSYKYRYNLKGRPVEVAITHTTTGKNTPPISGQINQRFFFGG
jgi:hypothetical protein